MPVSMMMPIAGSSPKVSGNSSVIPASGPSPGNTPTMVPQKHPMKQYNSPFQDSAIANPPSSWSKPVIALKPVQNGPVGSCSPSATWKKYQHAAMPIAADTPAITSEHRAMSTRSTAPNNPSVT